MTITRRQATAESFDPVAGASLSTSAHAQLTTKDAGQIEDVRRAASLTLVYVVSGVWSGERRS